MRPMKTVYRTLLLFAALAAAGLSVSPARAAVNSREVLLKAMKDRFGPIIKNGIGATCPKDGTSWHNHAFDKVNMKDGFRRDSVAFCDSYLVAKARLNSGDLSPWNAYEFYAYRPDRTLDNRYIRLLVGPFLGRRECNAHRTEVIKSKIDVTLCRPADLD